MPRKFIEDTIFYKKVPNRKEYLTFLDTIDKEELTFANQTQIQTRHQVLKKEIELSPSDKLFLDIAKPLNIPQKYMQKNLNIKKYFEQFLETKKL